MVRWALYEGKNTSPLCSCYSSFGMNI